MAFDLSSTTPAAPAGNHNVTFQSDGVGNISAYEPDAPGTSTEPANEVLAGPTSGAAALPTFRLLVAADIPALPESAITSLVSDLALKAPLASPTFTGSPAAPTPSTADSSTKLATTAYVQAQGYVTSASAPSFADDETPSGTLNGTNVAFTLAHTPSPAGSLQLFLDGILQRRGTDYTLSAGTITYTNAPTSSDTHTCWYRY